MKPTRIKYKLNVSGEYESVQSFLGNEGVLLKSVINPTTSTVMIFTADQLVDQSQCNNFTQCKKLAKQLLMNNGVSFFEETRTKKAKALHV